jgi:hypothetical protein
MWQIYEKTRGGKGVLGNIYGIIFRSGKKKGKKWYRNLKYPHFKKPNVAEIQIGFYFNNK